MRGLYPTMRRLPDKRTIRYAPRERVVVLVDGEQKPATVLYPPTHEPTRRVGDTETTYRTLYRVRLADGRKMTISDLAIVKQADTGGVGYVEHLETF